MLKCISNKNYWNLIFHKGDTLYMCRNHRYISKIRISEHVFCTFETFKPTIFQTFNICWTQNNGCRNVVFSSKHQKSQTFKNIDKAKTKTKHIKAHLHIWKLVQICIKCGGNGNDLLFIYVIFSLFMKQMIKAGKEVKILVPVSTKMDWNDFSKTSSLWHFTEHVACSLITP